MLRWSISGVFFMIVMTFWLRNCLSCLQRIGDWRVFRHHEMILWLFLCIKRVHVVSVTIIGRYVYFRLSLNYWLLSCFVVCPKSKKDWLAWSRLVHYCVFEHSDNNSIGVALLPQRGIDKVEKTYLSLAISFCLYFTVFSMLCFLKAS